MRKTFLILVIAHGVICYTSRNLSPMGIEENETEEVNLSGDVGVIDRGEDNTSYEETNHVSNTD